LNLQFAYRRFDFDRGNAARLLGDRLGDRVFLGDRLGDFGIARQRPVDGFRSLPGGHFTGDFERVGDKRF
jgi:hypothetical protein